MKVGVLALQGDFSEHTLALRQVGAEPHLVRRPEDLTAVSGLVIPGGESTTLGMLLDSSDLREPVHKLVASGVPTFGTCAGMILLARSITDGRADQLTLSVLDIDVQRNGFGRQLQSFECDLDVEGLGAPLPAVFIRAPLVERAGARVKVLAVVERGSQLVDSVDTFDSVDSARPSRAPVLVREGNVLASAFHPELTPDRRLHRMFVRMIDERARG